MKIVTINDKVTLAHSIEVKEGVTTVKASMTLNEVSPSANAFADYLVAKHMGELQTTTVSGGVAMSVRDLTEKETIIANDQKAKFKLAESLAMPTLVTDIYRKMIG